MRDESSEIADQESGFVDALQFAKRTLSVEHDSEMLEEAVHAKQTRYREFVFERSLRSYLTSGNKERNIVKKRALTPANSLRNLSLTSGRINAEVSGKISMKQAASCS